MCVCIYKICVYMYITESLFCTPETQYCKSTTLITNF